MRGYAARPNMGVARQSTLLLISIVLLVSGMGNSRLGYRDEASAIKPLVPPAQPAGYELQNGVTDRSEQEAVPAESVLGNGPLRVNPVNRRYFMDGTGQTVYLTGSSFWDVLQDSGTTTDLPYLLNYSAWLDFLQGYNHNFFRLYMWEQSKWVAESRTAYYWEPTIYMRTGPGNALDGRPKFDLNRFNQAYFDRMRARTIEAGNRGMYVSVMLFNGWSVDSKAGPGGAGQGVPWLGHPYNLNNNINGINGDPNGNNSGIETEDLSIPAVTALQEAYVRKVIDTVGDLDNVLFEICNECADGSWQSSDSAQWQYHMVDVIRSYEATKPKQHPVGITHFRQDSLLFNSNADWISINDSSSLESPYVADGSKVIILDTDHICGICGDRKWVWKSFTRGKNPIFMDQYNDSYRLNGGGYNQNNPNDVSLRQNMGYTRNYANRMNLAAMTPQPGLCSTGYCLAHAVSVGAEYLVYLPNGGTVTVNLSAASGQLALEWFNPATGSVAGTGTVMGGASRALTAPFSGDAVLYIYAQAGATQTPTNTATRTATSVPAGTQTPISTSTRTPTSMPTSTSGPGIVVLQPSGALGIDSFIYSGAKSGNFGSLSSMGAGEDNNLTNRIARSLIKFDLSSIPANATITSATLSLWTSSDQSSNNRVIRVYRLKVPFNESQVSWSAAASGVNWQVSGASGSNDRESIDIGSVTILNNEALNIEKQIPLTPAKIQELVNGTFVNNGFIIVADTEQNDRFNYNTSDGSVAAQWPKLVIQYVVGTGASTNTAMPGPSSTVTLTRTPTPALTSTSTSTAISTSSPTSTASRTATPTSTATQTASPTFTPTVSATSNAGDLIFADGFESGSPLAWSSSATDGGDLSVSSSAALTGSQGLQAVIDDNNSLVVIDEHPASEPRYRVRFYFDPNSIPMSGGDTHVILQGLSGSAPVLQMELRFRSTGYELRAMLANDSKGWSLTSWISISDAPHVLELDWRAATAVGANNGGLTFWIDGVQRADLTGIDNDTRRIDQAQLGAVSGVDSGTRGTYYFDAFESRRSTYIGP